jgi:hypothetical protein
MENVFQTTSIMGNWFHPCYDFDKMHFKRTKHLSKNYGIDNLQKQYNSTTRMMSSYNFVKSIHTLFFKNRIN